MSYEPQKFLDYFGNFLKKSYFLFIVLTVLFFSMSMMFPSETESQPKDFVELIILWLGFFWLLMIGSIAGLKIFQYFAKRKIEALV